MKIALASKNEAKFLALERALARRFESCEIVRLRCDSGVSATPQDDDEAIRGCLARIAEAKRMAESCDGVVALEGLVSRNAYGTFVYGWCVIEWRDGRRAYGCSGRVRVPEALARRITPAGELSRLVAAHYPGRSDEEARLLGANGLITDGAYSRVDEFDHAITCALGYTLNEANRHEAVH